MAVKTRAAWSQDEEDYLIENAKKLTMKELCQYLNRSKASVQSRIHILGIKRKDMVKEYHDRVVSFSERGMGPAEIGRELNFSTSAVSAYMKHNNIFSEKLNVTFAEIAVENGFNDKFSLPQGEIKFREWFLYWYQTYRSARVRDVTRSKYRNYYGHICKHPIADVSLRDLNRGTAQEFMNHYGEQRSKRTVFEFWQHMKSCLNDAKIDGHIHINSFENISPIFMEQNLSPKELKAKRVIWNTQNTNNTHFTKAMRSLRSVQQKR